MMIPYPSSSPIVNYTYTTLPDSTGTVLAGVGVAVLGTTIAVVGVFQFMKPKVPPIPSLPVEEEQQQQQQQPSLEEEKTHIVISTSDKNEIMKLLQDHQKDFSVL
jgi:H+/gluconate symporter-like permease